MDTILVSAESAAAYGDYLILGIDPGLDKLGYAFLLRDRIVRGGEMHTTPRDGDDAHRGFLYAQDLLTHIATLQTRWDLFTAVGVFEKQFVSRQSTGSEARGRDHTQQQLAFLRGQLTYALQSYDGSNIDIIAIHHTQGKAALSGDRQADKHTQVDAANSRYGLSLTPGKHHLADAIGIAERGEAEYRLDRLGARPTARTAGQVHADSRAISSTAQDARLGGVRTRVVG